MWAGVTSQPQRWEEIQRNELECGVSLGGILCWGWANISLKGFSALPEGAEARWPWMLCSEGLLGHRHPELAGSPQEQSAGLCVRLSKLREMPAMPS